MSYIPVMTACERLGISNAAICISAKYKPFYKKSDPDKRNAMFNLDEYIKKEDLKKELIEKTKLFTEYLYYIEGLSYTQIGRIAGVGFQTLHSCNFGYKAALKICVRFREFYKFHWSRFHLYYNYPIKETI